MSNQNEPLLVTLNIESIPPDHTLVITSIVGALAVLVAGALAAFIAYRTNEASIRHARQQSMDANFKDIVVDILTSEFDDL